MANDRSTKDKEMAAHLKKRGIFHGIRQTHTRCEPRPNLSDVGSAAYRRMQAKKGQH